MLVNKAQVYLPWIAVALCVVVGLTYVLTRPASESYDQCMARIAHADQSARERDANASTCAGRPRKVEKVIGE